MLSLPCRFLLVENGETAADLIFYDFYSFYFSTNLFFVPSYKNNTGNKNFSVTADMKSFNIRILNSSTPC